MTTLIKRNVQKAVFAALLLAACAGPVSGMSAAGAAAHEQNTGKSTTTHGRSSPDKEIPTIPPDIIQPVGNWGG